MQQFEFFLIDQMQNKYYEFIIIMFGWKSNTYWNSSCKTQEIQSELPCPITADQQFSVQYFLAQGNQKYTLFLQEEEDNKQGQFNEFSTEPVTFNEANSSSFKDIVNDIASQDLSYFEIFWNPQFQQKLYFILDNWLLFKLEYSELLQSFLFIIRRKLQHNKIYDRCFPGLQKLLAKISEKLEDKGVKGETCLQESKEDVLFGHFLDQQQARTQKVGTYFIKLQNQQKKPLGSYIAQQRLYQNNEQIWKRLFFIGSALKRYNIDATNEQEIKKQCKKVYRFADLLLSNYELTQPTKRICCSKFFYTNFDICPLGTGNLICRPRNDPLRNRVNQLYERQNGTEPKGELKLFDEYMKELMLDICSLLNRGGGVVLLFAKKNYLQTWVQGDSIIQDKKQLYLKLLQQALESIKPKVVMGIHIKLTFVPLVKNPYQYDYLTQLESEHEKSTNRNYVQGLYCPRITVIPSQPQKLYQFSWNQLAISAVYQNKERVVLNGEKLIMEKKRKYEYFHVSDEDAEDEQTRELLTKDYLYHERHVCPQPYPGYPLHACQRIVIQPSVKEYKYMSMLVAYKSNHEDIQRKLTSRGIECHITNTYLNLGLKSSSSSTSIYHNLRFDQLFQEIAYNKDFEYNGKAILLIAVTNYIKLTNRTDKDLYPKVNLTSHLDFIKKVFPNNRETVELFSFVNEDGVVEQFIKTSSRESMLLVYYLLHNAGEKSIFKNPKNLEKVLESAPERWRLIYGVGR